MANATHVLLVEGRSDEAFFSAICQALKLTPRVQVAPPRLVGGNANNKEGVFNHLPILLNQFADGRMQRLGVIVDADHKANHGLGYQATVDRFTEIVSLFGFSLRNPLKKVNGGLMYQSSEGFSDIGLWVMPGTQSDGMLEDWVKNSVIQSDRYLFNAASKVVDELAEPKFVPIHKVKAEVATWLAWQEAPGRGMESAIVEKLLDNNNVQYGLLSNWLKSIFV